LCRHFQIDPSPELDWLESILTVTPDWKSNLVHLINHQPLVQSGAGLRLLTMHGAKGLEFQTVILPALEEDSQASPFTRRHSIQEEEHLIYVAVTRCKLNLYLSYSRLREIHHQSEERRPARCISIFKPLAHYMLNATDEHKPHQMSLF